MQEGKIVIFPNGKKQIELERSAIHYIQMKRNDAFIYTEWGGVYKSRITFEELTKMLEEDFLVIRRGCLVNAAQIHHIGDQVVLNSGQTLKYVLRQKRELVARVCAMRNCKPESITVTPPKPAGQAKQEKKASAKASSARAQGQEADVRDFSDGSYLTVIIRRKRKIINVKSILYVNVERNHAEIHLFDGTVYRTRITLNALKEGLGAGFIMVSRSRLVSSMAIHSVTDKINLINGESLDYTLSRRGIIRKRVSADWKLFLYCSKDETTPTTLEAYQAHYRCYETAPFAFADIEMVFNDDQRAVDWLFRYGNQALARLEKMPLNKLIGSSFGHLFSNMDPKWLRSCEQAVLFGKTLEITDYSPEIDTNLKVICFPTFPGHCGCILFNLDAPSGQLNSLER